MTSAATTNRARDMWNNCGELNGPSDIQTKQYNYKQYPMMPNLYNYQNNYVPNADYYSYTNPEFYKSHGNNDQANSVVKVEPGSYQDYQTNYHEGHANIEMINRWREMNYYRQQQQLQESYRYNQRSNSMPNQMCLDNVEREDSGSINSPGQCSLPETSYGSPQSATSNAKPASPDVENSTKLRTLLTKPQAKANQYKTYTQEILQRMMNQADPISGWDKNNEAKSDKECNLSQFHGGYENAVEGQTSIKSHAAGGGAALAKEAQSSLGAAEPCQDVTRVEAGGDNADYAENKMAAAADVQGFYPWMKSIGGKSCLKSVNKIVLTRYIMDSLFVYAYHLLLLFQARTRKKDPNERDRHIHGFKR